MDFKRYAYCPGCTIDQQYVDGVSITHGRPQNISGHWQQQVVPTTCTVLAAMILIFHSLHMLDMISFAKLKVITLTLLGIDYGMEVDVYLLLHDAVIRVPGSVRISLKLLVMTLSFESVQMKNETMKMFILNMLNFTFNKTNFC